MAMFDASRRHLMMLACSVAMFSTSATAQIADPVSAGIYDEATAAVETLLRDEGLAGVGISVLWPGMQVWNYAGGYASRATLEPFAADTPNALQEFAQLYTAVAVLQLVEAGIVDLDAPFSHYFPAFAPFNPSDTPFTSRQLLSHHSGLPAYYAPGSGFRPYASDGDSSAWRTVLEKSADIALVAAPGEVYEWSYLGYTLLGLLIEQQSGERYEDYVTHHILEPLALRNTHFTADPDSVEGVARGHEEGEQQPHERLRDVPAAGLVSSVHDTATLLNALLQGGTSLLRPESVRQLFSAHNRSALDANLGMGFGVFVSEIPGLAADTVVVSQSAMADGARTYAAAVPSEGIAVVLTTNEELSSVRVRAVVDALLNRMHELRMQTPVPGFNPHPATAWTPERRDDLLGTYVGPGGLFSVKEARSDLRLDVPFLPFLRVTLEPREDDYYGVQVRLFGLNLGRFAQLQAVAKGLEGKMLHVADHRLWYWFMDGIAVATLTELPPPPDATTAASWQTHEGIYESEFSQQRFTLARDAKSGHFMFGREGRGLRRWRDAPELFCASPTHLRSCSEGLQGTATRNVLRMSDDGRLVNAYGVSYLRR